MKKAFVASILMIVAVLTFQSGLSLIKKENSAKTESGFSGGSESANTAESSKFREIAGNIQKGETLTDIFARYKLDLKDLFRMREASASIHRLRNIYPDRPYKIIVDDQDQINSFSYWIDDDTILNITNTESGFSAEKITLEYERRIEHLAGVIKDNLVSSISAGSGGLLLALKLSDIFAWDIDFNTDIRNNDKYKLEVEGLYLDGVFKKYGEILGAEFVNKGEKYRAYRYEFEGKADYFNEEGKSVKKAFLKAPLSFRRISSAFSKGRLHPVLKIKRPHHGLDYAAPHGTPVSASGDGTISFAGVKGQYGKLVILNHRNGYKTYYGHLSGFTKGAGIGSRISQGEVIGYVGSTGLATGPHLHYEMRINGKPVDPQSIKIPRGNAISPKYMKDFARTKSEMDARFAAIRYPEVDLAEARAEVF
jgi:murein DD-endopeptidase MepM/ murein hydrolase activator NlpD